MAEFRSDLLKLLDERGYIHQLTDAEGLDSLAQKAVVTGYIGFDATAPSLHVGNLVSIMLLRRMQQAGHRPIVLMGGGTTKVGDPSGKDESRRLLSEADIAANIASIRKNFESFLTFGDGPTDAIMLDNAEWLDGLEYLPFLREVGRHFTINRMLTFDSVRLRLEREQPMTFLEFNYMILQAYDFLELSRRAGCRLQLGGSARTITGSSGGTATMPTSAASCGCSPTCRWTKSAAWSRWPEPRSTKRRSRWPMRRRRCSTARMPRERPRKRRGRPSLRAAPARTCRPCRSAMA